MISVLVVGCRMLAIFYVLQIYIFIYFISFIYEYTFFLYDLKEFKSITLRLLCVINISIIFQVTKAKHSIVKLNI